MQLSVMRACMMRVSVMVSMRAAYMACVLCFEFEPSQHVDSESLAPSKLCDTGIKVPSREMRQEMREGD